MLKFNNLNINCVENAHILRNTVGHLFPTILIWLNNTAAFSIGILIRIFKEFRQTKKVEKYQRASEPHTLNYNYVDGTVDNNSMVLYVWNSSDCIKILQEIFSTKSRSNKHSAIESRKIELALNQTSERLYFPTTVRQKASAREILPPKFLQQITKQLWHFEFRLCVLVTLWLVEIVVEGRNFHLTGFPAYCLAKVQTCVI